MDTQNTTVTLYLDNDEELECEVLCTLTANKRSYIALCPMNDDENAPVYLYRYALDKDGQPQLDMIADDDEFEAVSDAYDQWLDTQDYETLDLDALGLDPLE